MGPVRQGLWASPCGACHLPLLHPLQGGRPVSPPTPPHPGVRVHCRPKRMAVTCACGAATELLACIPYQPAMRINIPLPLAPQVCERTAADKKGGHLCVRRSDGKFMLRESAMCPDADKKDFEDIKKHRWGREGTDTSPGVY